jgi:hypothetical protein
MLLLYILLFLSYPGVARDFPAPVEHSVAVVMDFEEDDYSSLAVDEMKREVGTLLAPCGVRPMWRDAKHLPQNEVYERVAVARFSGSCRMDAQREEDEGGMTLGFTHISDDDILPFVDLDCDRLRRLVRPAVTAEGYARTESLFGRALARVLVHELYHVLAGTRQHGRDGVTKPALSPQDLLRFNLPVGGPDVNRIRFKLQFR